MKTCGQLFPLRCSGIGNGLFPLNKVKGECCSRLETIILFFLNKIAVAGIGQRSKLLHCNLRHLARPIKKFQMSKDLGSLRVLLMAW